MAKNEFENEVQKFLRSELSLVHKIPDSAFNREGARQTSKKPFDFFGALKNGKIVAVEAKRRKANRIEMSALPDHQMEALRDITNANGLAFVAINFRVKAPGRICGRAYMVPFDVYECLLDKVSREENRKSIGPQHIHEMWELERVKGGWTWPKASSLLWG